eukprot:gb/GFBE01044761.1/.p1 GENE.gb/GFBE01044761.1/~~gb/GFBE01044761.1/.p1  ORF type:complete len:230 (+),score=50.90 gb/GFBE01044761.1/:1-690(+)
MDALSNHWKKVLYLGGAAATAGLLWYLLREADEEEEQAAASHGSSLGAPGNMLFCVSDPKGAAIGIRELPDVNSNRTGMSIISREVFEVSDILPAEGGQTYLKLADGRGWVFTHSSRDGRLLCQPISPEEAVRLQEEQRGSMQSMMADMNRLMESNPELRAQIMASPELQAMMADPTGLREAAAQSPHVAEALSHQPGLNDALSSDPDGLADALRDASTRTLPPPGGAF